MKYTIKDLQEKRIAVKRGSMKIEDFQEFLLQAFPQDRHPKDHKNSDLYQRPDAYFQASSVDSDYWAWGTIFTELPIVDANELIKFVMPEKWWVQGGDDLVKALTELREQGFKSKYSGNAIKAKYYLTGHPSTEYYDTDLEGVEITVEQFYNHFKKTEMEKNKLTRKCLVKAYNFSNCSSWQNEIANILKENLFKGDEDEIEIPQKSIELLLSEGNARQKEFARSLGLIFEEDKSVAVTENYTFRSDGKTLITSRTKGEFKEKAFYLSDSFNWEMRKDNFDVTVLIPTKK